MGGGGTAWHQGESFGAPAPSEARGPVTTERRQLPDMVEEHQSPAESLAHSWCLIKESSKEGRKRILS